MLIEFNFETDNFYGEVCEDENKKGVGGWFEHNEYGDEYGGGLWFEWQGDTAVLVDYDGVAELPGEVIKELEREGFNMDWGKV